METMHSISEMSTENLTNPDVTPEKLAIMKLRDSFQLNGRSYSSESGTPTGRRQSFDFSSSGLELSHAGNSSTSHARSSSVAGRSSRQVSTSTRRSNSFRSSHGSKVSLELTRQAEGKFFALMDLISSASREATSLKEVWSGMIRERESLSREREELMEQITEVTETLERKESEHDYHGHELGQRKKQVESLLIELSTALTTISDYKKKGAERDHEHLRTRKELHELRDNFSRTNINYDKLKSDFEVIELRLRTSEEERDHAKRSSEQYQEELRTLTREHAELNNKYNDTTFKLDTARKEIVSSTDRLRASESERDSYLVEKERIQELLRKSNLKNDEISLELLEKSEKYDALVRDINRFKETIRDLESERDSFSHTVEHLRREIKTKTAAFEEIESRTTEITLKLEHLKRENIMTKDKLSILEVERTEQQEIIEKLREESRLFSTERHQLRDDVEMWRHRHGDQQRVVTNLQESLRKSESTLVDVRSEIHSLTERLSLAERERSEARDKSEYHTSEITQLKEKLVIVQAELRVVGEARDRLREEVHEHQRRYEEVTETITDFRDSSGGYEFEIENLRTMLKEAREQKERAITARHAADRERDDYVSRYEEKCREMEQFEASASSRFYSQASLGGKGFSSSRVLSRTSTTTGTTIRNGESEEHDHGNGNGGEHSYFEEVRPE